MTAAELREARKRLRMTQLQFSIEVGLTPTYLSRLETGAAEISKTIDLAVSGLVTRHLQRTI